MFRSTSPPQLFSLVLLGHGAIKLPPYLLCILVNVVFVYSAICSVTCAMWRVVRTKRKHEERVYIRLHLELNSLTL